MSEPAAADLTLEEFAQLQLGTKQALDAFAQLQPQIEAVGRALVRVADGMDQHLWKPYRAAGQPFGPTYRGRYRWYLEHGTLQPAREALTEAALWQDAAIQVRRLMDERGIS